MEKMDGSVKDVLLKRSLTTSEDNLIEALINKMHQKGVTHGDLKPSNIGVFLNDGQIIECKVLDTQKVRIRAKKIQKAIDHDWATYRKHYKQNREA